MRFVKDTSVCHVGTVGFIIAPTTGLQNVVIQAVIFCQFCIYDVVLRQFEVEYHAQ